eukprot:gene19500-8726_t
MVIGTCELISSGDTCDTDGSDGCWDYWGDTADGRPYFRKTINAYLVDTDVYLYYDRDCDGPSKDSAEDHGQWIVVSARAVGVPDPSRTQDLDNNKECPGTEDNNAAYTEETSSMVPPTGAWNRRCHSLLWSTDFKTIDFQLNCANLPQWKLDYTLSEWGLAVEFHRSKNSTSVESSLDDDGVGMGDAGGNGNTDTADAGAAATTMPATQTPALTDASALAGGTSGATDGSTSASAGSDGNPNGGGGLSGGTIA